MIAKEIRFLLTHSSIYGLGTVVSSLLSFILLPLYTRYLTPSDYGVLALIQLTSGFVAVILTVGIANALSRFYYESEVQNERNKVVSTTYLTYFFIAFGMLPVLFYISAPLSQLLFKHNDYTLFLKIAFLSLIIGGLNDIGMMYLRLVKRSLFFIVITTTNLLLLIALNIIFIVYFKMGILGILYSSLIGRIIYAMIITVPILWKTKVNFSLKISRDLLKYSLPLVTSNLASGFVKQSDKYFVLHFLSLADVGIYTLAMRLGTVLHNLVTIPFNMAYMPRRFEIMKNDNAKEIYAKIFTYYIFFIVYVGLALSVLIPEILQIMVTPKFYKAGVFVPLVVFSMLIFGCHYHVNFGILHSKQTKYLAYINLTSALINLGLNFVLIRKYGLWGGVTSSVIVISFQGFLLYIISNKLYQIPFEFLRLFKYLFIAFIFYAIARQVDFNILVLNMLLKVILLLLFPVAVLLFQIINMEEREKLKEIYKNRIKPLILERLVLRSH